MEKLFYMLLWNSSYDEYKMIWVYGHQIKDYALYQMLYDLNSKINRETLKKIIAFGDLEYHPRYLFGSKLGTDCFPKTAKATTIDNSLGEHFGIANLFLCVPNRLLGMDKYITPPDPSSNKKFVINHYFDKDVQKGIFLQLKII